jgi:AraC-like DNA-binding protein
LKVTGVGLLGVDLFCRGGAAALLLMIAVIVLRDHRTNAARLAAALALAGAAGATGAAPGLPSGWWHVLLTAMASSGPVVFWLWARATFDDDFVLKPVHAAVWAIFVAFSSVLYLGDLLGPRLSVVISRGLTVADFALALLAAAGTVATWGGDLVAGRRRLRIVVLIGTFAFITGDAATSLSSAAASTADPGNFGRALGLVTLALVVAWAGLRTAAATPDPPPPTSALATAAGDESTRGAQNTTVDPALLRRLDRLMSEERVYRREGLTIGALAATLGLPEYRLRQAINEGLGHRNFNAYLNRYRIDEARAALADPGQKDVPVLTIAMDAGFQSIGPFNRAFKADAGMTPTEFRRRAIGKDAPGA